MSVINDELADRIFDGIDKVREGLPVAAKLAELLDPKDALIIEGIEYGLSKLFELVVALRSHPTIALAAETLQAETLAQWKLDGK